MEFEVYEEAVKNYKNYKIYSDWTLSGSSKARRKFRTMKGYYLESKGFPDCTIVGDCLTSNKIWGNARKRENQKINERLDLYNKLYHSNGNYVPIPEIKGLRTGNLGGRNCDTFTHHLNVYKNAIEKNLTTYMVWQVWGEKIWIPYCEKNNRSDHWVYFVEEFYLWDFVDENKNPISFVPNRVDSDQVGIRAEDSDEIILETIERCIELFVVRDYRIKEDIKKEFTTSDTNFCNIYKKKFLKNKGCNEFFV